MKKLLITFIMIFILGITNVYALDSGINSINIKDKSSSIIIDESVVDNNNINPKIVFKNVGDYVTYTIDLNIDTNIYAIESVTDNNQSEHIKTTYTTDNNVIDMKLEYKNALATSVDLEDIQIKVNLKDKDGNNKNVTLNPKTKDNIIKYVLILVITALIVIGLIILKKKKLIPEILILIILIPIIVIAKEKMNLNLVITKNDIKVGYNIVFSGGNGGIGIQETKECYFGEECVLPKNVYQNDGKKFLGWATEIDGDVMYLDEDKVTNLIAGGEVELFAIWENVVIYPKGKTRQSVKVGDKIKIGTEEFYVVSNDGTDIVLLARYNLKVGNIYTIDNGHLLKIGEYTNETEGYGMQSSEARGYVDGPEDIRNGTVAFSNTYYWQNKIGDGLQYPGILCDNPTYTVGTQCAYIYDNKSIVKPYVDAYQKVLEEKGAKIKEARLLKVEEAFTLGCGKGTGSCKDYPASAPSWVYDTTYWLGSASDNGNTWFIFSNGQFGGYYNNDNSYGIRPVIVI